MIFIHDSGSEDAVEEQALITQLHKVGPKQSFVTVFVKAKEGFSTLEWNAGDCCGEAKQENVDDIAYFREVIHILINDFGLDQNAIFLTGWGNGASMAYRLSCELF